MPPCERGGISSGDKHRLIFGDRHMVLPHAPLLAIDAKLVCDALGVFVSLASVEAGDEHRASRLMARIGLGDRDDVCSAACSPGNVQRPSGPKARICGDDPRCVCGGFAWMSAQLSIYIYMVSWKFVRNYRLS